MRKICSFSVICFLCINNEVFRTFHIIKKYAFEIAKVANFGVKQTDVAKQEESDRRNRILFASFASNDILKILLHAIFATFATTKRKMLQKLQKICMKYVIKY